jgi:hypothetical protein
MRTSALFLLLQTVAVHQPDRSSGLAAAPLGPGRYCVREQLEGYTGRGSAPLSLGEFWMTVDVSTASGRTTIRFANQMPDSGEILSGGEEAVLMPDGGWYFEFTDGWGNRGRGKLSPAAVIELEIIEDSSDPWSRNIGRNYGSFELSAAACAGLAGPLE